MTDTISRTAMAGLRLWPRRALRRRAAAGRARRPETAVAGPDEAAFAIEDGAAAGPEPVASGTRLCRQLDLYHDGDAGAVSCARRAEGGLSLACGAFGGSYLSLVAAVPEEMAGRFRPGGVLRLAFTAETSRPLATFLRLNIASVDGHEVFHETLIVHLGARTADFDLDGMRLPFDGRLRAWADIIFARPDSSAIALSGLGMRLLCKTEL